MFMGLKGQEEADELGWQSEYVMSALVYSGGKGDGTGDAYEHLFEFQLMVLLVDGGDCGESWVE